MTSILFCACLLVQATSNQTDWTGGPGATGPVTDFGSAFSWSDSVVYTSSGRIITMTQTHAVVDSWTEHVVENNSNIDGHGALRPADFDGDGDYDLAGAIDGLNRVRVYRNQLVETGVPNFTAQVDVPVRVSKYCLTWVGDFNRDSRPDIVVPGDSTFWFENNGNWSFTKHFIGYVDHSGDTNFCDVGDVDNDGDMDVVNGMLPVVLWRNNGDGTFARESIYAGRRYRAKLGDLNGDGYLDLLQADWVFLNRGPGYPTVFPTTPNWQSGFGRGEVDGIWITDFESDQNRDLLLCRVWGSPSTYAIYWYQNDGSGVNYTRHTIATGNTAHANGDAAIAEDMDLDGFVDVVGGYSSIGYFHQYPSDSFTLVPVDPSFGGSGGCHWVEVRNLCERPGGTKITQDIMASGSGQFHWWENGLVTNYARHAWLVSSVLDAEAPSYWQWLKWNGRRAVGTELDLYVRTGSTPAQCTLKVWQGPFPANSARDVDSVNILPYTTAGDRYFQYRVFMAGCNDSTPSLPAVLYDVWVTHERIAHDVGVVAITSPAGAAPPGPVVPAATLRNFGDMREPVRVYFDINSSPPYQDNVLLSGGLPFADTTVTFRTWTATAGSYQARCSTWMATDEVHANDVVRQDFTVSNVDVGVVRIAGPWGTLDTEPVIPAAVVRNFGATAASFKAWFGIGSAGGIVYQDSADVTGLASGDSSRVQFSIWPLPHPEGSYSTRCSTWIALDGNHGNDVADGGFRVARRPGRWGWVERATLPASPSGKAVKDGGWLAHNAGDGLIYAAKGNKTSDFYVYHPAEDSWKILASWPDGREAKKPGKGATGRADGAGRVYATKGNNTQGFWMYDAAVDSWYQKADVPLGTSKKKVKGGTDAVYYSGYVYLLKGYKNEFLKYDVANDSWAGLSPAPLGHSGKNKYDKGSWIAFDDDSLIYAHKAKYHELFSYDVARGTWSAQLSGMPFIGMMGKKKKSKDGGCGAWLKDSLYALKGGNTQEFWQYRPQGDSWNELDTMPSFGSALKKKKVKAGAALAAAGSGVLYAFKGNKTNEFWKYMPYPAVGRWSPAATRDGISAGISPISDCRLSIFPNPTRGRTAICYALPGIAPARLDVFNAAGQLVISRTTAGARDGLVRLDGLHTGAYLVQLTVGNRTLTGKLVVER
jgi:hypothetical protein